MAHAILIVGLASGLPTNLELQFVKSFDPEAFEGRGELVTTPKHQEAKTFDSFSKAHRFWLQQSKTLPVRPDGKPNRPLTAFTVEICEVG